MPNQRTNPILSLLYRLAQPRGLAMLSDQSLLERFIAENDETAFSALVGRHGVLVLSVCRRILHHTEDAEDAFQAVFLVLARKASSISRRESLGTWLYSVATRIALKARTQRARRKMLETRVRQVSPRGAQTGPEVDDIRPVLDEALGRLPAKYRTAMVLCYLEGKSTEEAARQMGCPRGTVLSRLSRARKRLRLYLAQRGVTLAAVLGALDVTQGVSRAAVPADLAMATVRAAVALALGVPARYPASTQAAALAQGALYMMLLAKIQTATTVALVVGILGVGAGLLTHNAWAGKANDPSRPELVAGHDDALRLPTELVSQLGIRTGTAQPRESLPARLLRLPGSTALDAKSVARIRSRVPGLVVEVAKMGLGDRVKKGDVLAVVQSKALAERKTALVDALVQFRFAQDILRRLKTANADIPDIFLVQARRYVDASSHAVAEAERALGNAALGEVPVVRDYVDRLIKGTDIRKLEQAPAWGRLELRAPRDGVLIERSACVGEVLQDPAITLFHTANLDRLLVLVPVPEADLPKLLALRPDQRRWTIRSMVGRDSERDIPGLIGEISHGIDPVQHTALAKGYVANDDHALYPGTAVTVAITLPTVSGELKVPTSALVEEGGQVFVFVQSDPAKPVYVQRRVLVVRRGSDVAHVQFSLEQGARVVTAGALALQGTLTDLKFGTK